CTAPHLRCRPLCRRCYNTPIVTSLQPAPTFALPATPFLTSSPEVGHGRAATTSAAAAIFGAPLDLTESFRSGAHGGPAAVRYMSDGLESYSPLLDRDLEDVVTRDLGDVDVRGLNMPAA